MLNTLADAIKAHLELAYPFKTVDMGFTKRVLQSPPSAAFFLIDDEGVDDTRPYLRRLTWEIALLASYVDPVKGVREMHDIIDAVRPSFSEGGPVAAGCLPTAAPRFHCEGVEDTLLIYTGRVVMQAVPANIS